MRYAPTGCVCTAGTSDFRRSFPAEIFSVGVDKLSGFFGFFRRSGNRPNAHDEGVLLMHPHSQNALLSLFGNGSYLCVGDVSVQPARTSSIYLFQAFDQLPNVDHLL